MAKGGSIYIITNRHNTVLYVGVCDDLFVRITEHREGKYITSFSSKYNIYKLVYFEHFQDIESAIAREKYIKGKKRSFKIDLINSSNPEWQDLFDSL